MARMTVAILGLCGLMAAMASAQAQSEFMSAEELPDSSGQGASAKDAGLHFGPLQVKPELDASYFHDTNPTYLEHGANAVDGVRVEPMLDLILTGNGWNAYARGWLAKDWYLGSVTNIDAVASEHYGESAGFTYVTPQDTRFSLTEMYEYWNGDNYAPSTGPRGTYNASFGDRYSFSLGAALGTRLGEKTGMTVGTTYSDLWYANPALVGWQDVGGTLGFSRKISDLSSVLLDFGVDDQSSDGGDGDSQSYRVLAGFGSRLSAKTSYQAEVGFMGYEFNNGERTAFAPTYNLSGIWAVSERLSAHVSGTARYQPSELDGNNYTLVDTISAGLEWKATRRLTTTLDATYSREDYGKADPGRNKQRDNQVDLSGRATYHVFHYTSVFVGAEYGRDDSTIDENSYRRLFLETGVALRF